MVISDYSKSTFTVESGLSLLWDVSRLAELRPEKLRMLSSGAVYPHAHDGAEFLYRESNGEYVLFDAVGPGCLVRYWTALVQDGTVIRFYFDGHTEADIEMFLGDMFTGDTFPWIQPVVGDPELSSGGSYSYLPMPYEKGCKVTLDRLPSFYHLEAINLAHYDGVETFDLKNAERWREAVETAVTRLKDVGPAKPLAPQTATIAPGQRLLLAGLDGPGVIDSLALKLEREDPDTLRDVVIQAFWDGESSPSVWSPIGDFFVSGHQKTEFRALPLSSTPDGFYCAFPMPFAKSARLELVNESAAPLSLEYSVDHRKLDVLPEDWGHFHARFHRLETQIGEYVPFLNTRGRGKFVGVSFNCQAVSPWMLEGDEVVWADGEMMPSIHGTGTEDYFSGAWYFNKGVFNLPAHGAPLLEINPTGELSRVSLYRFHTLDPFSFSERIRVCIEHGQELSMQGSDYCYTTYWYQTEPHVAPFAMPPAPERRGSAATVLSYIPRFGEWQKAVEEKRLEDVAALGRKLISDFPNAANLNHVRWGTGDALRKLDRVAEAVEVWRSIQDYFGVDYRESKLCEAEAWVWSGRQGKPPLAALEIRRVPAQKPGAFDAALWASLPVATDFHPHFPVSYYDLPADVQTEARAGYDDKYLYVQARCLEPKMPDLAFSKKPFEEFNQERDSFAVGLDAGRGIEGYAFLAVDPEGKTGYARVADGRSLWFGKQTLEARGDIAAQVLREEGAWVVELRVPLKTLGLDGALADTIHGLEFMRTRVVGLSKPEVTMWGSGIIPVMPAEFSLAWFK